MLSNIIVQCFVKNLNEEQLKRFIAIVLIPQNAKTLIENANAALEIIRQKNVKANT